MFDKIPFSVGEVTGVELVAHASERTKPTEIFSDALLNLYCRSEPLGTAPIFHLPVENLIQKEGKKATVVW